MSHNLTPAEVEQYQRNGYLFPIDVFDQRQVDEVLVLPQLQRSQPSRQFFKSDNHERFRLPVRSVDRCISLLTLKRLSI